MHSGLFDYLSIPTPAVTAGEFFFFRLMGNPK